MSGAAFMAGIAFPRAVAGGGPRMSAAVAPPPARSRSLYEVLRVGETATAVEIKAAYRSMAKLCHPDVAPAGEQGSSDFLEIHRAYRTLSDPAERAQYDVTIRRGRRPRPPAFATAASAAAEAYGGLRARRWETDQCW